MKILPAIAAAFLMLLATNSAHAAAEQAAEPTAGTVWVEPATGMKFVWVPSGCFRMGDVRGADASEKSGKVCLKGFYLGMYEVTEKQYEAITGKNPSRFNGADHPVEQVSYIDVKSAVSMLNSKAGGGFRLPSETEWEYACRAGGIHSQYCGEGAVEDLAWDADNADGVTHGVGQKQPNAWGLYDMSGNVWEWVADCWHDIKDVPLDGTPWRESAGGSCADQMVRSGSFEDGEGRMQAGTRDAADPQETLYSIGFRLARTPQ